MEYFLATVLPRPADTVGHLGAITPKYFLCPPIFVVVRKICFKHMIKIKIFPPKNVFSPQTLKPGYGPVQPKLCLQLEYFVLKSIRPRDVAYHNFFYKPPLGSPCKHFGEPRAGLIRHWCHA